jgi:hypothetical protein
MDRSTNRREIGTTIHLNPKRHALTQRGKNRIDRGGITWMAKSHHPVFGTFWQSVQNNEAFWIRDVSDPHFDLSI